MFDEFNGSYGEKADISGDVGDEDHSQDIMTIDIRDIFPMEQAHINDEGTSSTIVLPSRLTQHEDHIAQDVPIIQ